MIAKESLSWHVGHGILPVGDSVMRVSGHYKVSTSIIKDSRLTKVDHGGVNAFFEQSHTVEESKSSSKTVASDLHIIVGVETFKTSHFGGDFILNRLNCILESTMHFTIAFWPLVVDILKGIKVANPIID